MWNILLKVTLSCVGGPAGDIRKYRAEVGSVWGAVRGVKRSRMVGIIHKKRGGLEIPAAKPIFIAVKANEPMKVNLDLRHIRPSLSTSLLAVTLECSPSPHCSAPAIFQGVDWGEAQRDRRCRRLFKMAVKGEGNPAGCRVINIPHRARHSTSA